MPCGLGERGCSCTAVHFLQSQDGAALSSLLSMPASTRSHCGLQPTLTWRLLVPPAQVEDLIKMVQQLPASASVVEAILPGLSYLDSRAAAALLKGLGKAGLGQRAVEVFDHLRALAPTDELAQLCDIFTYTTMISQCNTHQQLRRAMELVAEMRSRAIPLNVHTYSALLNVCLKANELDLSLDVYARMLEEGVTPNLVTYNTLLDIYNKTGRWMDALKVLELLQHQVGFVDMRRAAGLVSTAVWRADAAEGRGCTNWVASQLVPHAL